MHLSIAWMTKGVLFDRFIGGLQWFPQTMYLFDALKQCVIHVWSKIGKIFRKKDQNMIIFSFLGHERSQMPSKNCTMTMYIKWQAQKGTSCRGLFNESSWPPLEVHLAFNEPLNNKPFRGPQGISFEATKVHKWPWWIDRCIVHVLRGSKLYIM